MTEPHEKPPSGLRKISVAGLLLTLGALIAVIVLLAGDVRGKLAELSAAESDSVPWQLSQLEVEFLTFKLALRAALGTDVPDLDVLQERFDIFYGRVELLESSPQYNAIRADAEFAALMQVVVEYRNSVADAFDQGQISAADLPEVLASTEPARVDIRELALFGVRLDTERSDRQRAALAHVLSRLAVLLGALVTCLSGALILVAGLVGRAVARSRDLIRTTARLKAVSETSLEAILVSDRAGRVLDFNAAAEEIFGLTAEEIIGRGFAERIIPEHLRKNHHEGMAHFNRTGEASVIDAGRVVVEACRADGETFPLELAISRTDTPDGEIFLAFMRDISQRLADEHALRQARDDALAGETAKASLLAVMSHEMRTPLNGILGTLELLSNSDLDAEQREHLEIMAASGDLLLQHVNDVLELSRLDSGQTETVDDVFDLMQILQEICHGLHHLAQASRSTVEIEAQRESLTHVRGDPRRLRQVLVNLVGNALKFTEDGTVTLKARRCAEEKFVEIQVIDTGIGIAPEDQERIFDEFVTIDPSYNRKAEGTGLGLAITQRLVQAMDGEISVASTPGQGSVFTVRLPLPNVPTGRRSSDGDAAPEQKPQRLDNYDVLLVEDNPINRRIARAMLEALGCTVTEAVDGAKGVEAAQAHCYDVILMDISMPEMDGVEATGRIRSGPAASQNSQIIALTAHAMQEDVERFVEAGMNDVVVKPISSESLAKALDRRRNLLDIVGLDETSPWDRSVFGEFLEVLGPVDTAEMLEKFLTDARETVPWLVWQSSEEIDPEEIARRAHALSGSAAVLGAAALHRALKALEGAARKGQALEPHGNTLDTTWARTERTVPIIEGDAASVA